MTKNALYRCNVIGMGKSRDLFRYKCMPWFKSLSITGSRMDGVDHNELLRLLGQSATGIEKLLVSGSSASYCSGRYNADFSGKFSKVS